MNDDILLEVKALKKYYPVRSGDEKRVAKALDGISFVIRRGETLGLVGESGCGKTTAGLAVLRLIASSSGEIFFEGQDITRLSERGMRPLRASMQMIFQDPYGCLDPRKTVYELIAAPLRAHGMKDRRKLREEVLRLMREVGLREEYADRYPHEFSGGQRQRIGIARAIAIRPKFIVCDEPVSALDVSVQAQVINLLRRLRKDYGLTYLFISHDLRVVHHLCDRIMVMYLGVIVESGTREDLFGHPAHPYTKALLSAVPEIGSDSSDRRVVLEGELPSPLNVPSGCRFHTRCPLAKAICSSKEPPLIDLGGGHICYCHACAPDAARVG